MLSPISAGWSRPDNSVVRHMILKQSYVYGCRSLCGLENCEDPHHLDGTRKCKRCLKLSKDA